MKRVKNLICISLLMLFLLPIYNAKAINQLNNNFEKCNTNSVVNVADNSTSESEYSESNGFDFIKSDKISSSIFEHSEILLYGGIFLIAVSVIGIVFTVMPRGNRGRKRNKRRAKH